MIYIIAIFSFVIIAALTCIATTLNLFMKLRVTIYVPRIRKEYTYSFPETISMSPINYELGPSEEVEIIKLNHVYEVRKIESNKVTNDDYMMYRMPVHEVKKILLHEQKREIVKQLDPFFEIQEEQDIMYPMIHQKVILRVLEAKPQ